MTGAMNVTGLECSECGKKYDAAVEQHLCSCGRPLLVRYDLEAGGGDVEFEGAGGPAADLVAVCGSACRAAIR